MEKKCQQKGKNAKFLATFILIFSLVNSNNSYAVPSSKQNHSSEKPSIISPTKSRLIIINGKKAYIELVTNVVIHLGRSAETKNAGIAAKKVNKTVIRSGDIFSYNKIVGEREKIDGYIYGLMPVSVDGVKTIISTLASGICRLAVALATAADRLDLEIISRTPHRYKPAYISSNANKNQHLSDSTVYWPSKDSSFRNTKNYDLYIETNVDNKYNLRCSFYKITWVK